MRPACRVAPTCSIALRAVLFAVALGAVAPALGQTCTFNPNQPSVTKGASITWTNDDGTTHTVTSGVPGTPSGKFDQSVDAGKTFSFTFNDAGTYEFFCNIHPSMRGTVTVR